ncbi:Uncharacterised protein [Acinetobacter junii]|jgi:uncharacterized protein (TIGR02646 family)|uniref:hypothetical protein n=1 Tax=Acinetobacter TaxID=469 RepID=UPI000235E24F|nr:MULTISPECIES: hypothetical protein [Acinetobacter]ENV66149.1 TIGR02646 family protein [Acinetobacter junii CIP 64.5]KXZ75309.1 hypothetical protein AVENLUH8758_00202 [Acinetobacter venetianus]MBC69563.1 hypothetical protein [Acinetobacter sp.]MBT49277.1 hypothetical protein [Acinetobacter sp.]MEB8382006.1 hypothetical protein [Acinetobacter junii]|tara:strand:- start:2295 stop:3026 length:732 start_codon:yes stop_codon:yes gene_type:complete
MIKLERKEKPEYLSNEKVAELTERFKINKKDTVWKHTDIHSALLLSSSSKCAFCEAQLQTGTAYMEIEHFKDKDTYPEHVVDWENLLPSCKRCNTTKGTHDVVTEPIINPFDTDPKEHLTQAVCRIYFKTQLGESTRDVLNLNDDRLLRLRFETWNYVINQVESIYYDMERKTTLNRRERNKLANLLTSCQSDRAFSGFASTALHQSVEYTKIIALLKNHNLWDDHLELLHTSSLNLILDCRT